MLRFGKDALKMVFAFGIVFSGAFSFAADWSDSERFFVPKEWGLSQFPHGKILSNPLDPLSPATSPRFDFFYFTLEKFDSSKKTLLFLSGGPGRVLGPKPVDLSILRSEYNIVYYHPRGGGLSQLPMSHDFDKYITSENIIHDIESIRKDLGIRQWSLVYGFSHGTILAQMYGHMYPLSAKRLVYDGATTWWQPRHKLPMVSQSHINIRKVMDLDRDGIFANLSESEKEQIEKLVKNVQATDPNEGVQQLLITGATKDPEVLAKFPVLRGLSREFFNAVDMSLYMGWSPVNEALGAKQRAVTIIAASELFPQKLNSNLVLEAKKFIAPLMYPETPDATTTGEPVKVSFPGWSNRIFLTVYPAESGKETVAGRPVYNPQAYTHSTETIIMNGSGDGVCPIEGVMEIFNTLLKGPRALFMVTGSNHGAFFKGRPNEAELVRSLVEDNLDEIKRKIEAESKSLPDGMNIQLRSPNITKTCSSFYGA